MGKPGECRGIWMSAPSPWLSGERRRRCPPPKSLAATEQREEPCPPHLQAGGSALRCASVSPQNPRGQGPSPPPRAKAVFRGKAPEKKNKKPTPSQRRRGGKAASGTVPLPSQRGTARPSHPDRPHPGGIYPKAEVVEGGQGQRARPSMERGAQTPHQKNSPKMEQIKHPPRPVSAGPPQELVLLRRVFQWNPP